MKHLVNTPKDPAAGRPDPHRIARTAPVSLWVLMVMVALEALGAAASALWLIAQDFAGSAWSPSSSIALTVLAAILAVALGASALGLWRRRGMARSFALTWQVLQIALAAGFATGVDARLDLATALGVPAIVAVVLGLGPSVRQAMDARG